MNRTARIILGAAVICSVWAMAFARPYLDYPRSMDAYGVTQDGVVIANGYTSGSVTMRQRAGWIKTVDVVSPSTTVAVRIITEPGTITRQTWTGVTASSGSLTLTEPGLPVVGEYAVKVDSTDAVSTDTVIQVFIVREVVN